MFTIPFLSSVVATGCWFGGLSSNEDSFAPLAMMIATSPVGFIRGWFLAEWTRRARVRRVMYNLNRKYELTSKDEERGKDGPEKSETNVLKSAIMASEGAAARNRRLSFVLQSIAHSTGDNVKKVEEGIDSHAAIRQYVQEASRRAVRLPDVFLHPAEVWATVGIERCWQNQTEAR